jgi:hypothetical protein
MLQPLFPNGRSNRMDNQVLVTRLLKQRNKPLKNLSKDQQVLLQNLLLMPLTTSLVPWQMS